MELKDFISNTIKQVTDGILEGDKYIKEKAPDSEGVNDGYKVINFDVAITTNEAEKDIVGGKVYVVQIFSAGASTESTITNSIHNRIQVNIAIAIKT
jgi:hypothetical protein